MITLDAGGAVYLGVSSDFSCEDCDFGCNVGTFGTQMGTNLGLESQAASTDAMANITLTRPRFAGGAL